MASEATSLLSKYTSDVEKGLNAGYAQPLTLSWRIHHTICYLIGGTTFVGGSLCYFPSTPNYVLGGWYVNLTKFLQIFS